MKFVIVVDTQRDFMAADGALSVAGAEALVPAAEHFLAALRPEDTAGILFTYDTHEPEVYANSPEAEQFPPHCVKGSAGWDNMLSPDTVDDAIPVYRLEKGVFDMWAEPDIVLCDERRAEAPPLPRDAFFERLRRDGVRDVTVIGVAADYCVKWAVEGLLARGFDVTVPESLTRGIARQIRDVAAEDFAGRLLVTA
ncbi:MAG TPA: isochorismatase family protein [Allosphingosinicella sp.]|jgi:nicotinamidase/pyrazinamidase